MYFAVGTLALAQAAQTVVGNVFTRQLSMPGSLSASYSLIPRYYAGLLLAAVAVAVYIFLPTPRPGSQSRLSEMMKRLRWQPASRSSNIRLQPC